MRPLEIPIPTDEERQILEEVYQSTRDIRLHMRLQMVFLAVEHHFSAAAIASIVRSSEETVRRWLKRWMAEGIEGLKDRPGGGAPAKITSAYEELLLASVRLRPRSLGQPYSLWTLRRLADYMAEQTGIRVTYETVRLILQRGDIVLSRPQHTISSPDPEYKVKKRRSKRHATG
ncbi:hypothetical protein KSF_046490 [Reticulibacter mediterranei]|uniref:Transposase n=1 Tax=Reticulibacter mediterranei TaxID=2778369 RepID=A0A8J3IHE5_9CHLR|nr:helix-turn-helix domain-containing protein [Reticulibacter mediterranei]GHO94601.1 hypothetical protein KSF_046490 [Reticulibacter mediterranei]